MADAATTRYGYVKPEVGASADTWGGKLNTNLDDADAIGGAITTTGSANAYVLTTGLSLAAYVSGQRFLVKWNFTNSGSATLNVDGLGAKTIKKRDGSTNVSASDLVSGQYGFVVYDGTNFVHVSVVASEFQSLDATLTALAALSYTSGTLYITMTAADTFALADDATLVKTTGTQTIAGAKTFTSAPTISSTAPRLWWRETDATVNEGFWTIDASADAFLFRAFDDAQSGNSIFLTVTRTGTTVDDMNIATTALRHNSVAVRVAGKTAVPIPASAMVPNTTNGAAIGSTETTTNKVMVRTLDFDTTTQEGAQFSFPMPKGWNESTVTFEPIWTADSGSGTVVFELRGIALSNDEALDTAFGTGQTSTDTLIAAGDVHIGPESSAITIGGTPAEGDIVFFQIRRVPASDTLGVDARLIGIRLFITTNAANDV